MAALIICRKGMKVDMEIFEHYRRLEEDLERINSNIRANLDTRKQCLDTVQQVDSVNAQLTGQATAIQKSLEYCQEDFKINTEEYAKWKANSRPAEIAHLTNPTGNAKSNVLPFKKRDSNEKPSL